MKNNSFDQHATPDSYNGKGIIFHLSILKLLFFKLDGTIQRLVAYYKPL